MQTKLASLRYDSARGAFEGRVDIERDGRRFRYPCHVEAPESAPRAWIEEALTRQALRMSDTDRPAPGLAPRPGLLHRLSEAVARALAPRPAPTRIPVRATGPARPRAQLR